MRTLNVNLHQLPPVRPKNSFLSEFQIKLFHPPSPSFFADIFGIYFPFWWCLNGPCGLYSDVVPFLNVVKKDKVVPGTFGCTHSIYSRGETPPIGSFNKLPSKEGGQILTNHKPPCFCVITRKRGWNSYSLEQFSAVSFKL